MNEKSAFDSIEIGLEVGPIEVDLSESNVKEYTEAIQWEAREGLEDINATPPGITIVEHAKMNFRGEGAKLKAAIWAKSEHEFIKPFIMGTKVFISGKVVDKYTKRGRNYTVSEYETVDENGELLMRSRETGLIIE
jgi:hypothetical protein